MTEKKKVLVEYLEPATLTQKEIREVVACWTMLRGGGELHQMLVSGNRLTVSSVFYTRMRTFNINLRKRPINGKTYRLRHEGDQKFRLWEARYTPI